MQQIRYCSSLMPLLTPNNKMLRLSPWEFGAQKISRLLYDNFHQLTQELFPIGIKRRNTKRIFQMRNTEKILFVLRLQMLRMAGLIFTLIGSFEHVHCKLS